MKIGIISCYNEGEANSEYTKVLETELISQGHDVQILRLPFSIFGNEKYKKQADNIIKNYKNQIKNFDTISIQCEYLLYGKKASDVLRRLKTLISACKTGHFSITVHNFKIKKKKFLNFHWDFNNIIFPIMKLVQKKQGRVIVHINRHKQELLSFFPKLDIIAHPLRYKRNEDIEKTKKSFSKKQYIKNMGLSLPKDVKIIGVIGTLYPYKEYSCCINALKLLPSNYHLFFFGGMHPLSFSDFPEGLPWINDVQEFIKSLKLENRVHFMGFQETTKDITDAHLFSDYVVISYNEIGESASAAAYTAIELNKYVFVTRNHCFSELIGFGAGVWQFDMNNYMELAEKILCLPKEKEILERRNSFMVRYNLSENVKLYLK